MNVTDIMNFVYRDVVPAQASTGHQFERPPATKPHSNRYKTELCRAFAENGTCRYGSKCQFAHGLAELRTVSRHPKYKTDLCRTFHTTGLCPYGSRCHFIHELPGQQELSPSCVPAAEMESLLQQRNAQMVLAAMMALLSEQNQKTVEVQRLERILRGQDTFPSRNDRTGVALNGRNIVRPVMVNCTPTASQTNSVSWTDHRRLLETNSRPTDSREDESLVSKLICPSGSDRRTRSTSSESSSSIYSCSTPPSSPSSSCVSTWKDSDVEDAEQGGLCLRLSSPSVDEEEDWATHVHCRHEILF